MNSLKKLHKFGQSFWLDYLRRSLITSGELDRMVDEDGLRGITSNPTIFEKAIAGSSDYDDVIEDSVKSDPHLEIEALFEELAITDIQLAADTLRPVYEESDCADGLVSFELSPNLACDTVGSIAEARRLWKAINRVNVMLKVPATTEGIPVIETLIAEGINVNVTLIFSLDQYEAVANAYIRGLENCSDPSKIVSVASFFLSRLDRVIDEALEENGSKEAMELRGKIAVANAKMAYKRFKALFSGERWEKLSKRGAQVQRVLWASTSTKNPEYSDVLYVEELIGSKTVNTIPPLTINAFRDHGKVRNTLDNGWEEAQEALIQLDQIGIDLNIYTEKLLENGVKSFADSIAELFSTLAEKRHLILEGQTDIRVLKLGQYQNQVDRRLNYWKEINFMRRIWKNDPTLWFPKPVPEISNRLGWLALPEIMHEQLEGFVSFAKKIKADGIRHVVLLGMGGSSLAPEVFQNIFGNIDAYPELIVLDSTHPLAVLSLEKKIDLNNTLFLVSSKSGLTIETLSLFRYFWEKMGLVDKNKGRHFVAITDSGSPLMILAEKKGFRKVFSSPSNVGGRFSALTVFGLLPAALMGVDVHKLLDRAWIMSENCAFCVSSQKSSGLVLGATLGELAELKRDKATFIASPSIRSFPIWLEQLIAESTGKKGKGIIPIVDEALVSPELYGDDRFFIYYKAQEDDNSQLDEFVAELEKKHPVVQITITEKINMSQEIFCWEMAVAAAGSVLGIHPFNQPNVQLAKDLTKKMMKKAENGKLIIQDVNTFSADEADALTMALKDWLNKAKEGDYFTLQAYLSPSCETSEALQIIREVILKKLGLATTLGYGPRFLHSTGQLHKGGSNTGLFLQFIDEPTKDFLVPETNYTFGTLIRAQALGDYKALMQLDRRVLRINLKDNVLGGLGRVADIIHNQ